MEKLREERKKYRVRREDLSKICKCSRAMIGHIERGDRFPSAVLAKRIIKALYELSGNRSHLTLDDFFP